MIGIATRKSFSSTAENSSTPDGARKHLKPRTPASTSASSSAALPGTTPPQNATSTWHLPAAAFRFCSSASTVVVAGTLLSGMSTIVVTPPAAAARVAVSNPSHSVRPGSLTWTCVSTIPGEITRSPRSMTSCRPAEAVAPRSSIRVTTPLSISMNAGRTPSGKTTRELRNITAGSTLRTRRTQRHFLKTDLCVLCVLCVPSSRASAPGRAFEKRPLPRAPDELPVLDHQSAARQHGVGGAGHLASLVRVVVDLHVERLRRQGERAVGIENDDVGVGAWRDRALLREQAEDLRRRRGRQLDEAVQRDAPFAHAAVVDQAHACLDAGRAVRDLREIVAAELFLLLHAERAVIGGDALQIVEGQAAPQFLLLRLLPQRRAHDVLRAREVRLLVVVVRQEQ